MIDYADLAARVAAGEFKALSIRQPWPHRIFHEGKDVENRKWKTKRSGWFLIHASSSVEELDKDDPADMRLDRGGIVGMARLVDCVTEMESTWFSGPVGFVLADAFPLPLVPCSGKLSFFPVSADVCNTVAKQILNLKCSGKAS